MRRFEKIPFHFGDAVCDSRGFLACTRIISGLEDPDEGEVKLGPTTSLGFAHPPPRFVRAHGGARVHYLLHPIHPCPDSLYSS
eukprot:1049598-Pleurochrysis_carterae.AAC.1